MGAYRQTHASQDAESCSVAVDMLLYRDRGGGGETCLKSSDLLSVVEAVVSSLKKGLNLLQPIGQGIVSLEESKL